MEMEIEPKEFDLIVLGTGLQESLIAGAAAKAGKAVLHLDSAPRYGSHWAGLDLDAFLAWAEDAHQRAAAGEADGLGPQELPPEEGGGVLMPSRSGPVLYGAVELMCGDLSVMAQSREFTVDLAPKVALCSGKLVDALLRSGAHNYLECKLLRGPYLWQHGRLCPVPASKAEIFKDRRLSPSDKRKLMRFVKEVLEAVDQPGGFQRPGDKFDDRPLAELLQQEGLSADLREFILYGLVLAASDQQLLQGGDASAGEEGSRRLVCASEGKDAMGRYIASVGRYGAGTGAFLIPLYGTGEVPQAFCRVAAVGGAIYVLRRPLKGVIIGGEPRTSAQGHQGDAKLEDPAEGTGSSEAAEGEGGRRVTGVKTEDGQVLRCSALAGNPESLASLMQPSWTAEICPRAGWLSRCVAITDAPLQEGDSQALVVIPPRALEGQNPHTVYVLQMGYSTAAAPQGRYLVYFWTRASSVALNGSGASDDLSAAVSAMLRIPCSGPTDSAGGKDGVQAPDPGTSETTTGQGDGASRGDNSKPQVDIRPTALVLGYYQQSSLNKAQPGLLPDNVALCSLPDGELDFQEAVKEAERLYGSLFPGEEMYPAGQQPGTAGDDSDEDAIEALGAVLKAAGITATAGEADSSAGTAASPQPGKKTVVPGASGEPPDASTGPTATRAEDLKQVEPAVEHPGNATYSE